MGEIDEIRDRVKRLEVQMVDVRADATAARALATAADRDVSEVRAELRAHTGVLNALRETQLEQGQLLAEHGRLLVEHGQQIVGLRTMVAEHGRLLVEHGQQIVGLRTMVGEQGKQIVGLRSEMREGFAKIDIGVMRISTLLANHLGRPDQG